MKKPQARKAAATPVATSGVKVHRYFPGKAPDAQESNLSESEDEHEGDDGGLPESNKDVVLPATAVALTPDEGSDEEVERLLQARLRARRRAHEDVSSDSSDNESADETDQPISSTNARPAAQSALLASKVAEYPPEEARSSSEGSSSGDEDSEDEEDDDERPGEYAAPLMLKPVFVPKSQRQTLPQIGSGRTDDALAAEDDRLADRENLARREESVRMAAAEATRAREAPDPDTDTRNAMSVDDTDDLDVSAEFEAWRQRELLRIKREKDAREAADLEQTERERIGNMSEEKKIAEGLERVRVQRRERAQQQQKQDRPLETESESELSSQESEGSSD
ncbi:hypothetical protein GGI04_003509 [Coemansia thaxteri]|uniref:Micro-fibrillar-associated protein 1 C-terminal domain-containing protein n=1 Tax=Coemansia thaxteri TaxID=2663907 RepID=A0A9W8EDT7_9FUNG|nr:hypothetical protein H4R26_004251 [Coemansia thaxteri]KAJ2002033.1 hypothetical protein GGI04_003509 [Coemansia thaxteri]KAJ2466940.1 hypothetical protein GGI02_004201 [Coemansia sp. RSA 2322]KAJ2484279.1 hypothetical protein EV174_002548 [Coemansia sp. RSA 2320]